MQSIFNYVSVGDLWALAIVAAVTAILAANCVNQKRRALARDRGAVPVAAKPAKTPQAPTGVAAHA